MAQLEKKDGSKQVVVELRMTLEEARRTVWHGAGPREQREPRPSAYHPQSS